ncbi:MAG: DegT/DnrJ/EryC1/StrS family aminotransferase [Thermonemataceae bacterium]|nr:DegT/DnrJ/EryC1/StrS family aminotransferase [Thermonemataceae bacterium]
MNIPFLDLKRQYQSIKTDVLQAIANVLEDTAFSGGKYIEEFEQNYATYCQSSYAVALNNGTSALHLAMLVLGIGKGDEVIIPTNTFIATAWGVSYVGATPVFIDCTADTWQIDVAKIEEKITKRTKAIVAVHLYGQPCFLDTIQAICQRYNLSLIEDAAQAHGAAYRGEKIGNFGELACFSFYPGKNLGTYGEGGAIITNNLRYAERLKTLRFHGSTKRYYHDEIGYNMRMGGIEAAVLSVKLAYLDAWNKRRKEIALYYQKNINNPLLQMQFQPAFADSVYHLFVITTPQRDKMMDYLQKKGIFAGLHYPVPCHLQKAYAHLGYQKGDCPNAEYLAEHCLSLPMFAELQQDEIDYVVEVLNNY